MGANVHKPNTPQERGARDPGSSPTSAQQRTATGEFLLRCRDLWVKKIILINASYKLAAAAVSIRNVPMEGKHEPGGRRRSGSSVRLMVAWPVVC